LVLGWHGGVSGAVQQGSEKGGEPHR
jgi:hypothetical protein